MYRSWPLISITVSNDIEYVYWPVQCIQCYPKQGNTALSLNPLSSTHLKYKETHIPYITIKASSILVLIVSLCITSDSFALQHIWLIPWTC